MGDNYEDVDCGFNALKEQLAILDKKVVAVGFPLGTQPAEGEAATLSEIATIAAANEFGTANIPSRPFLSSAVDAKREELNKILKELYDKVATGKLPAEDALKALGLFGVVSVKENIKAIQTPPNAPSTIAQKGSSNPLIRYGQMVNSVHFHVRDKGKEK